MLASGTVTGDYRIVGVLGRGGMAVVYEAVHRSLERRVALKLLGPELGADPAFVERFRREGRLQASLDHPHVVTIYEAGESDHGLFLAMRLVRGPALAALVREGRLDAARALRLLRQVADALDAAHAAGLVHRDIKPHNVLVGENDDAYLADFGLTRSDAGVTLTDAEAIAGTPAYLAPEIIGGDSPTSASDRYSLAAMAYECLAGSEVFPRSTAAAAMYAHTTEEPPPITERRRELPVALDDVFANALAKDPSRRPATAAGFVDSLDQALASEGGESLGPPPRGLGATGAATTLAPQGGEFQAHRWHRRAAIATVSALAGAALGAIAVAPLAGGGNGDGDPRAAEPAPPLSAGSHVLGSRLEVAGDVRTAGCRGRPPSPGSPGCSVMQETLPGRTVLAPRDGAIRGWAVRGAVGELALQILRERDGKFKQVSKSQVEVVSDPSPHRFATNLPVESGDAVALVVSPGASVGVRSVPGATTSRWLPRLRGFFDAPTAGPGSGFDHELLLRAEYAPGGEVRFPPQINGRRAASAPDGKVLGRESVTLAEGGQRVQLVVVELEDAVALDLLRNRRRAARVTLPRFRPGGRLTTFAPTPEGFVDLEWINVDSSRVLFEFFGFDARSFIYFGS